MEESSIKTKKVYVELELLEHIPSNANVASLYPHNGVYLCRHEDDVMSVVYVEIYPDGTYLSVFNETFIGNKPMINADSVVHVNELKAVEERCRETLATEKERLEAVYEKKRMELDHEYEVKMLELEHEMPKRFEQGERVSVCPLTEIIKTLVTKQS